MYYKLDENKNVLPSSLEEWATFIEGGSPANYWVVGKDKVNGCEASTIFVGLNYDFGSEPKVFETAIFDKDEHVISIVKYSTWKDAEEGHKLAVKYLRENENNE